MTLQNCVVCKKCCKFTISLCKNDFKSLDNTLWWSQHHKVFRTLRVTSLSMLYSIYTSSYFVGNFFKGLMKNGKQTWLSHQQRVFQTLRVISLSSLYCIFIIQLRGLRFPKVQGFPLLENKHGGVTTSLKINVIFLEKIDHFLMLLTRKRLERSKFSPPCLPVYNSPHKIC